nr:immunoglobulin heavy chain junction region [Macaca mulatta]MOX59215.1 immunoglobulin heavy chain junction region [Macaca mulatta]MOX59571.1 immunoglobulin heavy chain junction region [Macaca mulatta]MOX59617.1 immunoglobulin heavy chain junction region [Macaca mulatta]MOX59968.1 immunoglobulin heavy chain junction region [Macaca mulatta]
CARDVRGTGFDYW